MIKKELMLMEMKDIKFIVFHMIITYAILIILSVIFITHKSSSSIDRMQYNLDLFQNKAESYIMNKVSIDNNEDVFITLNELYENKIILKLKDKNDNYCIGDASYVRMERLANYYKMTTVLVCEDESSMIIKYIR